ncbi:hypothetical protein DFA_01311 [Cavenderia fasciculata]|uniref:t-SNARE coiled-coil homology domain-containing protein n=1 Tax=Cavenderia fasciculata TaxID=261658 RepID=F4PS44_CACFS|nr:uncharacterized protein DFA_01311 [Cavenderia fasciculata]EGG21427.1 hypothetical protein DFA_01311 [Cavenderia fasciculata]|eukprot:XP_004359277.1 hypothetical protein DFA_01311 [Cavenderia fasciculata]
MDSLFKSYEDDMKKSLNTLDTLLNTIKSCTDNQSKQEPIKKAEILIKSIDEDMESLSMEANNLNKSISTYRERLMNAKTSLKQIKGSLDYQNNMNHLMEGGSSGSKAMSNDLNTRERMDRIQKTMESGNRMIKQSISQVQENIQLTGNINMELAAQGERLKSFDKRFDDIDGQLQQADKTMKKMEKRWFV